GPKTARPQPAGDPGDTPRQLAVIPGLPVVADRRLLGQPPRHIEQQRRQVHFSASGVALASKPRNESPSPCPSPRRRGEGTRLRCPAKIFGRVRQACCSSPSPRLRGEGRGEGHRVERCKTICLDRYSFAQSLLDEGRVEDPV